MSASEIIREQEHNAASAVRILYVCDWPPSNASGGSILMGRLLEGYPADSLVILTGSHATRVSTTDGRLPCTHIIFPTSKGWGSWGVGRIRTALDWLRLPWLTMRVIRLIRLYSREVVITILHGRFYFGVWAAARITRTPYVMFVHDYYLNDKRSIFGNIVHFGTRVALRDAAKVFA